MPEFLGVPSATSPRPCNRSFPSSNLSKTYASGFEALKDVNLEIRPGEIFALLGPNGAGKTTLINIICGIVKPGEGTVLADGYDIVKDYRETRSLIGLVPQELTTDAFETVWATVCFSRGLFGKPPNPAHIEKVLKRAFAVGQEGRQDHDAVGRHEAAGDDRQGAVATSPGSCSSTSRPPASTSNSGATCGTWSGRFGTPA